MSIQDLQDLKYDIRRGADTYSAVYHPRLKSWILKGIINREEALVWRSGLSGWRRPEELEELKPYFEKRKKEQLRRTKVEKVPSRVPQKEIQNILIIDDEEDLCWLLSSTLSGKGYHVATANTLQQGMALLKENLDLVFLDLKLPDGDGMDILPMIKEQTPEAFVVVISAYGSGERMEDASDKGVYGFIDKPFTEEKIMLILERFRRSHAKRNG
ncbi:MAG: response regulator [Deltaproteobacteria bacterium]|nr:response regulator [Deltaproteobacteria bacterium]